MFSYSKFDSANSHALWEYPEPISADYRVFLNGEEIPVYTCRISQYPFNRVWPDFQRPFDQSEQASFVNIVSDEDVRLEVIVNRSYQKVMIKPYSKEVGFTEDGDRIRFCLKENGGYVLEADSYHHCLYIFNSKPVACPNRDEVTHYFGPGVHFSGKIHLHDNESIYVDKDALVYGCIFARGAKNIRIFGNGLFDDSSEARFYEHAYKATTNGNIKLYDCENVSVEGVSFRNSAIWCVSLFHCKNVILDGIKVFGQWRYNTDGVDIVNSRDVSVRNAFIHSFDDAVTIKGIDWYIESDNENIRIENSVLWCDWGKTCEVGIETACRKYRDIVFCNCDILRGGNTALDIQNGDCADVADVLFENIRVEYNSFDTPEVYQYTDDMVYGAADQIAIPNLISISNHRYRQAHYDGVGIVMEGTQVGTDGLRPGSVHDVTVRNIRVYYDEEIPKVDGKYHVPIVMRSCLEGVCYSNIAIENVVVNGVRLTKENAMIETIGVDSLYFDGKMILK